MTQFDLKTADGDLVIQELMCTPRRALLITHDGTAETIHPYPSWFAADHPLVTQHRHEFRTEYAPLSAKGRAATRERKRTAKTRAVLAPAATRAQANTHSRNRLVPWRLPEKPPGGEVWRLSRRVRHG
jgi:hypothetical protein